ncbi:MAG: hypothetical protein CVU31_14835 [Betaproteobacteria bacterium HGW-Betaproteobacteria-4]|nr:MAG: hypothetical protein CVU31_14835 [Betaproteobacteria bacterium HGW-Betaproteobacteria-4]
MALVYVGGGEVGDLLAGGQVDVAGAGEATGGEGQVVVDVVGEGFARRDRGCYGQPEKTAKIEMGVRRCGDGKDQINPTPYRSPWARPAFGNV